jgi:hypothetical protein
LGGAVQPSAPTAHRELLLSISPLHDTQQIVESQAKVLGADNATRRARMAAARTYKADPAALRALVGEYTSVIGEAPSRVSTVDDTRLRLALSMQGATMDVELIPYSRQGFIANTGIVKGWAISFEPTKGGRTTLAAQGIPVAQNRCPPEARDESLTGPDHLLVAAAFGRWGVQAEVLTDNGAVFTGKQRGDGRVALEVQLGLRGSGSRRSTRLDSNLSRTWARRPSCSPRRCCCALNC